MNSKKSWASATLIVVMTWPAMAVAASDHDEFRVKREAVFDFVQKPTATREGQGFRIAFESKGACDVTVAIEHTNGKIMRHLASGVLGENAPTPFQKGTLKQSILWDGKDDQGRYIDDLDEITIRVSLGLKPMLEKKVFGSPKRRIAKYPPIMAATPEGVYVFEGIGVEFLRLFDHDGNYVRTVYPFDHDKLEKIKGLKWHTPPQSPKKLPFKHGFTLASMLTSGTSCIFDGIGDIKHGRGHAATTMAIRNGRIALAYLNVNRLHTDGTTGGLPLKGGRTGYRVNTGSSYGKLSGMEIGPSSAAFSPDGKTLYLTGYLWKHGGAGWVGNALNGVIKLDYEKDGEPEVFAGKMTANDWGDGPDRFTSPTSVTVDKKGRVYVSDFANDRVQVFSPEGKLLKSIAAPKPAKIMLHEKTQELWVCSFMVFGVNRTVLKKKKNDFLKFKPGVTVYGAFDNPKKKASYALPVGKADSWSMLERGQQFNIELDSHVDPPRLWIVGRKKQVTAAGVRNWGKGFINSGGWEQQAIRIFELKDKKWTLLQNFGSVAKKEVLSLKPPDHSSQRLHVNPKTGRLYIHEQRHPLKSVLHLIEVNPETNKRKLVTLPFDAEDIAFDLNGRIYLRTDKEVVRYDPRSWREVPFDYGEERAAVGFSSVGEWKKSTVISALPLPGQRPVCYNMGGMWVSPKGHVAVSTCTQLKKKKASSRRSWKTAQDGAGRAWTPQIYPGRIQWQQVHVWNKHGQLIFEDAVKGLWSINGVTMDQHDNLYMMADASRVLDGKRYPNEMIGTLVKMGAGKNKTVGTGKGAAVPLQDSNRPKGNPQLRSSKLGNAWAHGAKWLYGGVGYGGWNSAKSGGGCACWHARFTMDLYNRSFAPEIELYSVAVLDTNGNLILRVGRYGNADSAGPKSRLPLGGDEVGLVHPAYVATHSDRRLFIADPGNGRIVSVKLGYHASASVKLKDVVK